MPSFQTFFRTVVMIAMLALAVKGWFYFGLTMDKVQEFSSKAIEIAQEAWDQYRQTQNAPPTLAGNPQSQLQPAPAPFMPPTIEPPPIHMPPAAAPALRGPVELAGGPLPPTAPALVDSVPTTTAPAALVPMELPPTGDRLTQLLTTLSDRGIRDLEVKPWGNGGQLYRFTCSAPWVNSPSFSRHFEAVAATPEAAVEQAAAEIEAWQRGQK